MPYINKTLIVLACITSSVMLSGCELDHTIQINVDEDGDGQKETVTVDISSIDDNNTEITVSRDGEPNSEPTESVNQDTNQNTSDSADENQKNETDDYLDAIKRDTERLSEVKRIQTWLEQYYVDHANYPQAASTITLGSGNFTCLGINGFGPAGCENPYPYMSEVPSDPLSPESDYTYTSTNDQNYQIIFYLETDEVGLKSGKVQATQAGIKNI